MLFAIIVLPVFLFPYCSSLLVPYKHLPQYWHNLRIILYRSIYNFVKFFPVQCALVSWQLFHYALPYNLNCSFEICSIMYLISNVCSSLHTCSLYTCSLYAVPWATLLYCTLNLLSSKVLPRNSFFMYLYLLHTRLFPIYLLAEHGNIR